ncbi:hypothetical protein N1851_007535 [Merluccius polli]|uniref:Uncharacterized protein n=1 Tax=Merluccius polli TaxID=89951 RepID=A0AA47P8J6_MERPO|nr:hypothetical protein N1851_007535 [Merluccius polli]
MTYFNEATNWFTSMARFNCLSTPIVYLWGSAALREAARTSVWGRVCPRLRHSLISKQASYICVRNVSAR